MPYGRVIDYGGGIVEGSAYNTILEIWIQLISFARVRRRGNRVMLVVKKRQLVDLYTTHSCSFKRGCINKRLSIFYQGL